MGDPGVTSTGLDEMRKAIENFPAAEQAALKSVAQATAVRELTTAQRLLRSQQKTEAHALADMIEIVEDDANRLIKVISQAPANQPKNLPTWNEYGTRFMTARPYMRPANDQEIERYRRDMEAASTLVAQTLAG